MIIQAALFMRTSLIDMYVILYIYYYYVILYVMLDWQSERFCSCI